MVGFTSMHVYQELVENQQRYLAYQQGLMRQHPGLTLIEFYALLEQDAAYQRMMVEEQRLLTEYDMFVYEESVPELPIPPCRIKGKNWVLRDKSMTDRKVDGKKQTPKKILTVQRRSVRRDKQQVYYGKLLA